MWCGTMLEICLLGATGSIGSQTLDIIREKKDLYRLVAFSFGHNINKALAIIEEFNPLLVSAAEEKDAVIIKKQFPNISITYGSDGLNKVATFECENPRVVNALVGAVGLLPTIYAIEAYRDVYLANKETLVIGGEIVMKKAKANNVKIIPIDSEHSAIYQLLEGKNHCDIEKLIITASGGAFRNKTRDELINVTAEDALKHPNWQMGAKITIDCATMMNKGFELIEAHYLFDLPMKQIEAILHYESIVHSMVEFKDGSVFAQLASSDMRLPIKYALEGPSHSYLGLIEHLNFRKIKKLSFDELSLERYPMLGYAIDAINRGHIYPTVLNAANEVAVKLFLEGKINFLMIEQIVSETLNDPIYYQFLNDELSVLKILSVDQFVRNRVISKYQ